MSRYSSRPAGPFEHDAAVTYLQETYELTEEQAKDLLARATQRSTGMASHPRSKPYQRTVWATHMTTQGGRFMIEAE
jgi:hypothetical protein